MHERSLSPLYGCLSIQLRHVVVHSLNGNGSSDGSTGPSMSSPCAVPHCNPHMQRSPGSKCHVQKIFLNRAVIREFSWLATTMESSDGVHMLDAIKWDESLMDLTIYCDVPLNG